MRRDVQRILEAVAAHFGASTEAITDQGKSPAACWARHLTVYLLRERALLSWPACAKAVKRKNHTSAMWSHRQVSGLRKAAPLPDLDAIEKRLAGL